MQYLWKQSSGLVPVARIGGTLKKRVSMYEQGPHTKKEQWCLNLTKEKDQIKNSVFFFFGSEMRKFETWSLGHNIIFPNLQPKDIFCFHSRFFSHPIKPYEIIIK